MENIEYDPSRRQIKSKLEIIVHGLQVSCKIFRQEHIGYQQPSQHASDCNQHKHHVHDMRFPE
jgi:hypothetical protein